MKSHATINNNSTISGLVAVVIVEWKSKKRKINKSREKKKTKKRNEIDENTEKKEK